MVKVKLLTALHRWDDIQHAGTEVEVSDEAAKRYVEAGIGELVKSDNEPATERASVVEDSETAKLDVPAKAKRKRK